MMQDNTDSNRSTVIFCTAAIMSEVSTTFRLPDIINTQNLRQEQNDGLTQMSRFRKVLVAEIHFSEIDIFNGQ
jgi:hypothetical protein